MSKTSIALVSALALALSAPALADIPPPKPAEPPAQDSNATQPSVDLNAPVTDPTVPSMDLPTPAPTVDQTAPALTEAQTKEEAEFAAREAIEKSLVRREGVIALPGGQATVTLGEAFAYLDAADTEKLLTKVWGNPPGAMGEVMGAIVPRNVGMLEEHSWAAILTYSNDGHVSDGDAASINYDDLLKEMQQGTESANEQRIREGYEAMTLVGWAQKPSYNGTEHKLYWAKHLRFGANSEMLNYAIRALGRTGVLEINVIADMKELPEINTKVPKLLSTVSFTQGHRYADFNESSDPVAAYGLAALVAGGVAAKAGLLKYLLAMAAASWKLIAAAVVGIGAVISRVMRGLFSKGGAPTDAS